MIESIISLRFFVIVLIYLHHLSYNYGFGPVGVSFFFVLSGYVISISFGSSFFPLSKKRVTAFLIRRFCRIYPLHLVALLLSIPILYYTHFKTNVFYGILNALLFQSFFPIGMQVFAFNGLSWFLSDLIFFYLLSPLILYFFSRLKINESTIKLVLCCLIVLLIEYLVNSFVKVEMSAYSRGWWFYYISPWLRICDFCLGIAGGYLYCGVIERLPIKMNFLWFSFLEFIAILLFCCSIYWSRHVQSVSFLMCFYYLPFCFILIFVLSLQAGIFSKILSTQIFVFLGNRSFSFFIFHQLAISYLTVFFRSPILGQKADLRHICSQIILFFMLVVVSDFIYRYFECPLKKYIISKT